MSRIQADLHGLNADAREMAKTASDAEAEFSKVLAYLEAVAVSFKGEAATAFDAEVRTWSQSATELIKALEGLGKFLNSAASAFKQTDEALAKTLGGSGGSATSIIGARVDKVREVQTAVRAISDSLDVDSSDVLSELGLSQAELGGRRIWSAVGSFQRSWSDARERIIESATAASDVLKLTADTYEKLNDDLKKALSG